MHCVSMRSRTEECVNKITGEGGKEAEEKMGRNCRKGSMHLQGRGRESRRAGEQAGTLSTAQGGWIAARGRSRTS